jgi:hypothetical protein
MRRKESRQQEQISMLMQMAVTGMMAYLGAKKQVVIMMMMTTLQFKLGNLSRC